LRRPGAAQGRRQAPLGRLVHLVAEALPVGRDHGKHLFRREQGHQAHAMLGAHEGFDMGGAEAYFALRPAVREAGFSRTPEFRGAYPAGIGSGFAKGLAPQGFGAFDGNTRLCGRASEVVLVLSFAVTPMLGHQTSRADFYVGAVCFGAMQNCLFWHICCPPRVPSASGKSRLLHCTISV
jgi:hypothetical protein